MFGIDGRDTFVSVNTVDFNFQIICHSLSLARQLVGPWFHELFNSRMLSTSLNWHAGGEPGVKLVQ